jgi:hypothetical protein
MTYELLPEIICLILSKIRDVNTINYLMSSKNPYLVALTQKSIREIYSDDETDEISFEVVSKLYRLRRLCVKIKLNSIDDVSRLASLPKLIDAQYITTPIISSFEEFLKIIITFISKQKGKYRYKMFRMISDITPDNQILFNNATKIEFSLVQYPIILGFDSNDMTTWTPSVNQLIKFLTVYNKHIPIRKFNDYNLYHSNPSIVELNILADYLITIPELKIYRCLYFNPTRVSTLLERLKDKIDIIVYNIYWWDYPRIINIKALTSFQLEWFPSSLIVKSFHVPITTDDIPLIIQKYPNLEHISIMFNKDISIKLFASYPKLKSIAVVANNSETIPNDHRFYMIRQRHE